MVRPETTKMLDQVLEDLATLSGLPTPSWTYFSPRNFAERQILGAYVLDQDKIYINKQFAESLEDTNPAQLVRVTAHEFRHYYQDQVGLYPGEPELRETDARRYETEYLELLAFPEEQIEATTTITSMRCGWYVDHRVRQTIPAEVLSTGVVPRPSTSRWIRYHLSQEVEEDYIFRMWRAYEGLKKKVGFKKATYGNFRRYVWVLAQLGLVKMTRSEPGDRIGMRHYYRVVEPFLDNPAWDNPQEALPPKD